MATKNRRVVGDLPPPLHEKLRSYMEAESLTESAAMVKIVKQFFEQSNIYSATPDQDEAIADLKADIASIMERLTILEQTVTSGRLTLVKSKTSSQTTPVLRPLKSTELAKRLGVNPGSIEEALSRGEAYFQDWSKRKDPASKAWVKRGNLFQPISE